MMKRSTLCLWLASAALLLACGGSADAPDGGTTSKTTAQDAPTQVSVASLQRLDMHKVVRAPGETVALVEQQLRAPYTGTLQQFHAVVGQRVEKGQTLGSIIARDSEAALEGARQMMREANSEAEKADAQRAMDLAQRNLIEAPLEATARGVITAVNSADGDRVSENQDILTIVAATSIVFRASVTQSDLAHIQSGQHATIAMTGEGEPVPARVQGLLGAADVGTLTAPLRIDFQRSPRWIAPGLFGTAAIEVASRSQTLAAPRAAVLRDDLSGVERMALVSQHSTVHWVEVQTGLVDGDDVEILSPELEAGQAVIVSGQIGLPEGARVQERP